MRTFTVLAPKSVTPFIEFSAADPAVFRFDHFPCGKRNPSDGSWCCFVPVVPGARAQAVDVGPKGGKIVRASVVVKVDDSNRDRTTIVAEDLRRDSGYPKGALLVALALPKPALCGLSFKIPEDGSVTVVARGKIGCAVKEQGFAQQLLVVMSPDALIHVEVGPRRSKFKEGDMVVFFDKESNQVVCKLRSEWEREASEQFLAAITELVELEHRVATKLAASLEGIPEEGVEVEPTVEEKKSAAREARMTKRYADSYPDLADSFQPSFVEADWSDDQPCWAFEQVVTNVEDGKLVVYGNLPEYLVKGTPVEGEGKVEPVNVGIRTVGEPLPDGAYAGPSCWYRLPVLAVSA